MSLTPKFSAQRFQSVLKTALGRGGDSVQSAMTHIGAQGMLKTGATARDAKEILRKLEKTGAISDHGRAMREYDRQERVAVASARMHDTEVRHDRLTELHVGQAADAAGRGANQGMDVGKGRGSDSVVREQAHGVSILGGQNLNNHSVGIGQAIANKSVGGGLVVGSHGPITPVQLAKPLLDIPFD